MITDVNATLSNSQTLIINASTPTLSTYSYDTGAAGTDALGNTITKDFGRDGVELLVQIDVTVLAAGGAAELMVELVSATDDALTGTLTVLAQSAAIAKATLVAGYNFRLTGYPVGVSQRYLGVRFNATTNNLTAGSATVSFVNTRQASANQTL